MIGEIMPIEASKRACQELGWSFVELTYCPHVMRADGVATIPVTLKDSRVRFSVHATTQKLRVF